MTSSAAHLPTRFLLQASNGLWVTVNLDGVFSLSPNRQTACRFTTSKTDERYAKFSEQCAEMNINSGDFTAVDF